MSRKTASFRQLLEYFSKDKSVLKGEDGKPIFIKHNVKGKTLGEMERVFMENEANRAYHRKGCNKLYHEIISWHYADTPNIDAKKIEAIARQYFRLRNENAMYVGAIHTDRRAKHLHLCVSSIETVTGKSIRISKAEFQELKEKLQAYEIEKFPELTNSVVDFSVKNKAKKSDREFQVEARTGKISRKEELKQILEKSFQQATSRADFLAKIREQGLETYDRASRTYGISDAGKHLRFGTLGFDDEKFQELNQREGRSVDLEILRGEKSEKKTKEQGTNMEEGDKRKSREEDLDELRNNGR